MPTALQTSNRRERFPLIRNAVVYDIAVVGAGPIGSLCAIAHARRGARVALFEGNAKASTRLAGEWLHPSAVRMLRDAGVVLTTCSHSSVGKGFIVKPEDDSDSIVLPYADEAVGLTYEHAQLVSALHRTIADYSEIDFYQPAKVRSVEQGRIVFTQDRANSEAEAQRIVGADGRASIVRKSLGLSTDRHICSRMIGVLIEGVKVPHEGFGHVLLGGPGPVLMFQLGEERVRIIVDVPLNHWSSQDRIGVLTESYGHLFPADIRDAFVSSLVNGRFQTAVNEIRPRVTYGCAERVLVGDSAGNYHPLTAVGMTLGFGDVVELAASKDFRAFERNRLAATRAPELLALGLYEVFVDQRTEAAKLRREVYRVWRASLSKRDRTMDLLACEDVSVFRLALTFFEIVVRSVLHSFPRAVNLNAWRQFRNLITALYARIGDFLRGSIALRKSDLTTEERHVRAHKRLARALLTSMQPARRTLNKNAETGYQTTIDVSDSIQAAVRSMLTLQAQDGSWEGEMVWCPMLGAQYVLLHHVLGESIKPKRRDLLLRQFATSRIHGGVWGLHDHSEPYLFVTTLVYVASRILGVPHDDELIAEAGEFIRREGVLSIPSWGKFWLAVLNLHEWRGVNAVLPEIWRLPR